MSTSNVSISILLSAAVGPLLLGIWASKNLAQMLQEAGEASEELFRGDRLPVLKMPVSTAAGADLIDPTDHS